MNLVVVKNNIRLTLSESNLLVLLAKHLLNTSPHIHDGATVDVLVERDEIHYSPTHPLTFSALQAEEVELAEWLRRVLHDAASASGGPTHEGTNTTPVGQPQVDDSLDSGVRPPDSSPANS